MVLKLFQKIFKKIKQFHGFNREILNNFVAVLVFGRSKFSQSGVMVNPEKLKIKKL